MNGSNPRMVAAAELAGNLRQMRQDASDIGRVANAAKDAVETILEATLGGLTPQEMATRLAKAKKALGDLKDLAYNFDRVVGNLGIPIREAVKLNEILAGDTTP